MKADRFPVWLAHLLPREDESEAFLLCNLTLIWLLCMKPHFKCFSVKKTWETAIVNKEKLNTWIGFHQEILALKSTTRGLKCHTIISLLIYAVTHYGHERVWAKWTELGNSLVHSLWVFFHRPLGWTTSPELNWVLKFLVQQRNDIFTLLPGVTGKFGRVSRQRKHFQAEK